MNYATAFVWAQQPSLLIRNNGVGAWLDVGFHMPTHHTEFSTMLPQAIRLFGLLCRCRVAGEKLRWKPHVLSEDHKPEAPTEHRRITAAGGVVGKAK